MEQGLSQALFGSDGGFTFITPPHFDRLNAHRPNSKIMHLVLNYAFGFEASVVCISMTCSYSL